MHGYNAKGHAPLSQGPGVGSKHMPQMPSQADAPVTAQQGFHRPVMMPYAPQQNSMPSQPDRLPQHFSMSSEATVVPQQYSMPPEASAMPQQYSMPQKQGSKPGMPGLWEIHAATGHMAELAADGQSSTFAVPADKVGGPMHHKHHDYLSCLLFMHTILPWVCELKLLLAVVCNLLQHC